MGIEFDSWARVMGALDRVVAASELPGLEAGDITEPADGTEGSGALDCVLPDSTGSLERSLSQAVSNIAAADKMSRIVRVRMNFPFRCFRELAPATDEAIEILPVQPFVHCSIPHAAAAPAAFRLQVRHRGHHQRRPADTPAPLRAPTSPSPAYTHAPGEIMTPAPMTATARQAHMPVEPGELPIPPTPVIPDPSRPVIDPPLPGDVPIKPPEPTDPPIIPPQPDQPPIGDPPTPPPGAGRH